MQWQVQTGSGTRHLCAECTRRHLIRFATEEAPTIAELLQRADSTCSQAESVSACCRCETNLSTVAQQGVAGCAECYRRFPQAVDEWLTRCSLPKHHQGDTLLDVAHLNSVGSPSTQPDASWLRAIERPQTLISSRARYARNFCWVRFPWRADSTELEAVRERVEQAARSSSWRFEIVPTHRMKPSERQRWIDLRLASPYLRDSYLYGSLIVDETRTVSVLVNEEDHLRVQAILPGLQVRESIALARSALEALTLQEELAFSDNYGWLTASILNIGWALRVSVMMHTPALERSGQLQAVWSAAQELGGTVRGMYGEGTPVSALFQVSNAHSIGIDEAAIAAQVAGTAQFIARAEATALAELLQQHAGRLHEEAEQLYHNLGKERTLKASDALQILSTVSLAAAAGWGYLNAGTWKEMLMAVRWEAQHDDAEWRALRMRTLVRQVRDG